jgi:hypothetical protein
MKTTLLSRNLLSTVCYSALAVLMFIHLGTVVCSALFCLVEPQKWLSSVQEFCSCIQMGGACALLWLLLPCTSLASRSSEDQAAY